MSSSNRFRAAAAAALIALAPTFAASSASAHEATAGDVRIGHPYAVPSLAGSPNGAAYLASLENTGTAPDRLLRASSPAAARVELHTMAVDAQGVMRMREVPGIDLVPKAEPVRMRPGMGYHFMLMSLKAPLKEGDTFPMTLEFERAGKVEVKVVVQVPKATGHAH